MCVSLGAALCVHGLGCVCGCAGHRLPFSGSVTTRLMYSIGLFAATVLAWILRGILHGRNWGNTIIPADWQTCPGSCFEYLAPYRVSFALVIYHLFFALFTIGVTTSQWYRAKFHNGWWPIKLIMYLGLLIASFYIPASFFTGYGYVAVVMGIMFLLLQAVVVLDFAYSWAEKWVEQWEQTQDPCWKVALFFVTFGSQACILAGTVLLYVFYPPIRPECGLNTFFITMNLVLCVIMIVCSVLPKVQEANPRSGMMQASILGAFLTYVTASAITSEPNDGSFPCFDESTSSTFATALFYIGFVVAFFALTLQAFSGGSMTNPGLNTSEIDDDHPEKDEEDGIRYRYWFFHVSLMLASGYMAVLLTNWRVAETERVEPSVFLPGAHSSIVSGVTSAGDFDIDRGFVSTWAKMVSTWVLALFYFWTLIAPIVMPHRFGAV